MSKERLIAEHKKISAKIQRNRAKGYSTENLERALDQIKETAKQKNIRLKDYANK